MAHFLFWASAGSVIGMSFHTFYKSFKEGIQSRRNFRQWAIDEVCVQRRNAFRLGFKEKLFSQSRAIEVKACRAPKRPLDPGRPYGLPLDWSESGREHVWRHILEYVDDPKDVLNVSDACPLFQRLMHGKYKAAILAEVYTICLSTSRRDNGILERRVTNDLLPLRRVCETTRKSVDNLLMKPRPHDSSCNYNFHHLGPQSFFLSFPPGIHNLGDIDEEELENIPLLVDFCLGIQRQARIPEIVKSMQERVVPKTLHLNDIFLNEVHIDNLPEVRETFKRLFELVGGNIRSFFYNTEQSGHGTYGILREWMPLLPNLEELRVSRKRHVNEVTANAVEPFPPAPKLTSFLEMNTGFPTPYLMEILKATPKLKRIELCHFPQNRLDALVNGRVFDQLPLEIFQCGQSISESFLLRKFNWPLKTIVLHGTPRFQTKGKALMDFVNQFGATLKELISDIYVEYSTGMIKLPHLTKLKWLQDSRIENLDFLNPLVSLEELDINTWLNIKGMFTKEEVTAYLKKHNVPRLFPGMKKIMALVKEEQNWRHKEVWKRGDDV